MRRTLAHFIRPKARLYGGVHWATPVGSSGGHTLRADLSRYAVNALEVVDPASGASPPRQLWPGFLQFERYEAEQLRFPAA